MSKVSASDVGGVAAALQPGVKLVPKKQPQIAKFTDPADCVIKQKYKLLEFCKGGAFGDVYFGKHVDKGYDVAIKFVSNSLARAHSIPSISKIYINIINQ
jgi:hypothetical protein